MGVALALCKAAHIRAQTGKSNSSGALNWNAPLSRLSGDGREMAEVCFPLSLLHSLPLSGTASMLWPGDQHPVWLIFPGDLPAVAQSLRGHSPE